VGKVCCRNILRASIALPSLRDLRFISRSRDITVGAVMYGEMCSEAWQKPMYAQY